MIKKSRAPNKPILFGASWPRDMKRLILCDFDGTISIEDTGYALLAHFSSGDWEGIDRKFCEGKIGSREAYDQIAEILRGDESSIRRFLQQHSKIDSYFLPFYQACRQAGIDVKIVSDGLDFYIRTILKTHHLSDIPFYANHAHFVKGKEMAITFPYANDECGRCGTCKKKVVQLHRKRYDSILFVGNGFSDRCGAREADFVFAKDSLYSYCVDQGISCHFFQDFGEILKDLKKKIRGVIFDLDGTLIEAYEAIYLGLTEAFRFFGRPVFPISDLTQHLKVDLEATLAPFFSKEEMTKAIPMIRKKYEEIYLTKTHFLEGAKEILESLSQNRISLAVASNKFGRFSRGALVHLGVAGLFKSILGAGDGPRNKPFPDMIEASLQAMDLPPEEVVFIGDSLEDVEAGKQAGVDVYALPTGVHTKTELSKGHPKRILKDLGELLSVVHQAPILNPHETLHDQQF
jgi:2,3-diketo-5-methylthio-1-phosphopentane phosphatase/HAD superfamily hydrolase (TIGR01509 family)